MYKRFARAYLAGEFGEHEKDVSERGGSEDEEQLEQESKSCILCTAATAAIGTSSEGTKWVINGVLVDTGSSV